VPGASAAVYEATFRIPASQPSVAATEGADGTIELWCNDHCDLLSASGEAAAAVLDHVRETVGVREHAVDGDDHLVVTGDCLTTHHSAPVDPHLREHGCLLRPPLRYEDGAKVCRVLAVDPGSLTALYRDLAAEYRVTVEAKREVAHPSTPAAQYGTDGTAELTARQRAVLSAAYEAGYYRIPREVTTAELADEFDLARRTVEEHLRRAENKLVAGAFEDAG